MKKFLTEHTPSFVSSQKQTQKMLRGGSAMIKPLALCTLISPTCAEKKRSFKNHGPCNSDGKDCTFGGRMRNLTDEERSSAVRLGVHKDMANSNTRSFKHFPTYKRLWQNCPFDRRSASQNCGPLNRSCNVQRSSAELAKLRHFVEEAATINNSRKSLMASPINHGSSAGAENIPTTSSSDRMQSLASSRAEANI